MPLVCASSVSDMLSLERHVELDFRYLQGPECIAIYGVVSGPWLMLTVKFSLESKLEDENGK